MLQALIIQQDDGTCLEAKVECIQNKTTANRNEIVSHTETYKSDLYLNYNTSTQSYTLSANRYDNSISVKSYLTIRYKKNSSGFVLLTSVSGKWVVADHTVSVTRAKLRYGCGNEGGGNPSVSRIVSNNFSYNTGYTHYVAMGTTMATAGANLELELKHGSSTWKSLLVCNIG